LRKKRHSTGEGEGIVGAKRLYAETAHKGRALDPRKGNGDPDDKARLRASDEVPLELCPEREGKVPAKRPKTRVRRGTVPELRGLKRATPEKNKKKKKNELDHQPESIPGP